MKKLLLKSLLLLCALIVGGASSVWANDVKVTFTPSQDIGTGTGASGNNSVSKDGITINCSAGGFAISGGAHYRFAQNSTVTITSTVGNIKSVVITGPTGTGNYSISKFGENTGWTLDSTNGTYTWSGNTTPVTVTVNTAQVRPTSIEVTYTSTTPNATLSATSLAFGRVKAGENKELTFTVTPANLTGALSITSNNVKYTVSPTSIAQSTTTATTITVTAAPTGTSDDMTGTITISGGGLAQNKTVSLSCVVRDPEANDGTAAKPYTVAEARVLIDEEGSDKTNMHVRGFVSQVDEYNSTYNSITYWISDDGTTTNQLEVYSGKGISGADFADISGVLLGDIVVVKGNLKKHNSIYEFELNNQLVSQDHATAPVINTNNVTIEDDDTSGEIAYTVNNPTSASLTAALTTGDWISNVVVDGDNNKVTFSATANTGAERTATLTLSYEGAANRVVTVTQKKCSYATLPFAWAGGIKSDLAAMFGVTTYGLGSDYAAGNGQYRVKFDSDNDYIQIKTNEAPKVVSLGIKNFNAIGASAGTKITIKGSSDGTSFTDIEEFDLNGFAANIHSLKTSNDIASEVRYIKILFTKGSGDNAQAVAVGPIYLNITEPASPVVDDVNHTVTLTTTENMNGWRTFYPSKADQNYTADADVYYVSETGSSTVTLIKIDGGVPANTPVILHKTSGTTITLTETASSITAPGASNLLAVSTANQNLGKVYRLGYRIADGIGFYAYTSTSAPAGIIYITPASPAREFLGFAFGDEEATGVNEMKAQKVDGQFYDLQGRKVANPTKGLYIVNGKKVVIK